MKKIDVAYLSKKINQLNKKIHRAEEQGNKNRVWWRKMKLDKLKRNLKGTLNHRHIFFFSNYFSHSS